MSTASITVERELLQAARDGDEEAYRRLVEPYHGELHAHCYRMLGSVHDAEDALQDALLRAWRGLRGFAGRGSARAWLYRIATNTCLDEISRRPRRRVLPIDHGPPSDPRDGLGPPLAETSWVEPYPSDEIGLQDGFAAPDARFEQRESVELAFVAALQHLPPRQRAVLILREVLGFSAREVAELLETTVAGVNSALQRARHTADERLPARSQQATLRALGDERLRELVATYVDAWERGDVDTLVTMLAEEATITMPPMATWYRGTGAIVAFLSGWAFHDRRWRLMPAIANGQLAVGCYGWEEDRGAYKACVLDVLTLDGPRIAEITAFVTPDVFGRFGLPEQLPAMSS